jgi:hypothetical protein
MVPKGNPKGDDWIQKNPKSEPDGAQREPKGAQRVNGVRGSGVKTKEIECDIVLKHEGGKLGSPLLL